MKRKLILRNVFGKPSMTLGNSGSNGDSSNGVITVNSLPAQGEAGRIYYNTTDGGFYFSNGSAYTPLNTGTIPIIVRGETGPWAEPIVGTYEEEDAPAVTSENEEEDTTDPDTNSIAVGYHKTAEEIASLYPSDYGQIYLAEPNTLYKVGTLDTSKGNEICIILAAKSTAEALSYYFRFTVDANAEGVITWEYPFGTSDAITVPDNTPEFEAGHTYEVNIFDGVMAVLDVTQ